MLLLVLGGACSLLDDATPDAVLDSVSLFKVVKQIANYFNYQYMSRFIILSCEGFF